MSCLRAIPGMSCARGAPGQAQALLVPAVCHKQEATGRARHGQRKSGLRLEGAPRRGAPNAGVPQRAPLLAQQRPACNQLASSLRHIYTTVACESAQGAHSHTRMPVLANLAEGSWGPASGSTILIMVKGIGAYGLTSHVAQT